MAEIKPTEIRQAISTIDKPVILRDFKDWPIFGITLEEWCHEMDENNESKPVCFTSGTMKHGDLPYWERLRTNEHLTFSQFLTNADKCKDRWHSHSYKDISSWPRSLKDSISFEKLGFGRDVTEDIIFWLGSAGANTPCHYDTYGFNIVVQVFGRKSWLLFPSETRLAATRVPYEESSVYCKQNFYSPVNMSQFDCIGEHDPCFEVTLNPGDVLVIPPNYWHYVENLETSLAVNTWIPITKHDTLARLGECFVRFQVDKLTESNDGCSRDDLRRYIYNPNELNSMDDVNYLNLFNPLANMVIENDKKTDASKEDQELGRRIRNRFSDVFHEVESITKRRLLDILSNNSLRYDTALDSRKVRRFENIENVLNAVCNPSTVANACEIYLQQIRNQI